MSYQSYSDLREYLSMFSSILKNLNIHYRSGKYTEVEGSLSSHIKHISGKKSRIPHLIKLGLEAQVREYISSLEHLKERIWNEETDPESFSVYVYQARTLLYGMISELENKEEEEFLKIWGSAINSLDLSVLPKR